jgi:polar amino acid transport system ATP-binding protein
MIQINGLIKRHGSAEILRGTTLNVARGEVAAIIGASGSGKSTLLRCINGLDAFQGGSVVVDGLRLDGSTPSGERASIVGQICRRVGMVFQAYHLFPHRSVLQNVTEGPIHVLGMSRIAAEERAARLLDRVGLGNRMHARPRELSGGQQQRAAIARTLAMEPRAILFDEPTSALDPRMTAEVLAIIDDLTRDGLTMVVVTHAMNFVQKVAGSVHVLSGGVIVESGSVDDVFGSPRHDATKQLIEESGPARPRLD